MATKKKTGAASKKVARRSQPLRFAHPYFTTTPPENRPSHGAFGKRMLDHVQGTLNPIPPVKRADGRFALAEIIGQPGATEIAASGQITLHLAGDTGVPETDHETKQVMVAEAMAKDYNAGNPALSPACFIHLGDVIYGPKADSYLDQFYRPYMHYPGKIIAIPGNHDGESAAKIADFQRYFCAPSQKVPQIAGSIFRQTVNQPGVFWCLDAPFVQVIGLYSNSAENPGFISGAQIGQQQKQWLTRTLKALKAERTGGSRKALLFATHHPPYSSGGHSGSSQMLADIDDACQQAGIMPDAFFSGHAHSIQHYTRSVQFNGKALKIPYVVTGCGGHGGQTVAAAPGPAGANPTFDLGYKGWGYTKVHVTAQELKILSYGVSGVAQQPLAPPVTVRLT